RLRDRRELGTALELLEGLFRRIRLFVLFVQTDQAEFADDGFLHAPGFENRFQLLGREAGGTSNVEHRSEIERSGGLFVMRRQKDSRRLERFGNQVADPDRQNRNDDEALK